MGFRWPSHHYFSDCFGRGTWRISTLPIFSSTLFLKEVISRFRTVVGHSFSIVIQIKLNFLTFHSFLVTPLLFFPPDLPIVLSNPPPFVLIFDSKRISNILAISIIFIELMPIFFGRPFYSMCEFVLIGLPAVNFFVMMRLRCSFVPSSKSNYTFHRFFGDWVVLFLHLYKFIDLFCVEVFT